jgi:hypothetical protein
MAKQIRLNPVGTLLSPRRLILAGQDRDNLIDYFEFVRWWRAPTLGLFFRASPVSRAVAKRAAILHTLSPFVRTARTAFSTEGAIFGRPSVSSSSLAAQGAVGHGCRRCSGRCRG